MYEDAHLEMAYEDRFPVDPVDMDDSEPGPGVVDEWLLDRPCFCGGCDECDQYPPLDDTP